MKRCSVIPLILPILLTCLMTMSPALVQAVDTSDTRLLATPAITEGKIAFVYADDIWVAGADGVGAHGSPRTRGRSEILTFAPDGKQIAFTASYDGNVDVYIVPVEGGEPERLTWHPGDDIVRGFTPEGKVLFTSQRRSSRRGTRSFSRSASTVGCRRRCRFPPATWGRSRRMVRTWRTPPW